MKITSVEVELVQVPAEPSFRWRQGLPGSERGTTAGILRVKTDEGVEGKATCPRGVILQDIVERRLRDELLGQNPFRREWLWERAWEVDRIEEMPIYVLGLADIALWDLAGNAYGVPVHELIGTYRDSIPAYASMVTLSSVSEYLEVADQCLELGYRAVKLHAWGDARRDAELAQSLRSHLGEAVDLMYDGSAGFDLAEAVYVGRALGEARYTWYEEPMREFSITAYKWLANRVDVPLLVAETSDGAHMNTADFIAAGCATYLRTNPVYKAGFTGALRIAHLADSFRLRAEVHGGGPVSAQLCMAIPNTTYYESIVMTNPVMREPLVDAQGMVKASTVPGVDFTHDPISLARHG